MRDCERRYYLDMMNQWLILKHEGKNIDDWLIKRKYLNISIYGMGVYGRHLVRELSKSKVVILYGIDQKQMEPYNGIDVYRPENDLPKVDLIVNTVICCKETVADTLRDISDAPIIGLDDLVFEAYEG